MLRAMMNLVAKGNKCRIAQINGLEHKGLMGEMIDDDKL